MLVSNLRSSMLDYVPDKYYDQTRATSSSAYMIVEQIHCA